MQPEEKVLDSKRKSFGFQKKCYDFAESFNAPRMRFSPSFSTGARPIPRPSPDRGRGPRRDPRQGGRLAARAGREKNPSLSPAARHLLLGRRGHDHAKRLADGPLGPGRERIPLGSRAGRPPGPEDRIHRAPPGGPGRGLSGAAAPDRGQPRRDLLPRPAPAGCPVGDDDAREQRHAARPAMRADDRLARVLQEDLRSPEGTNRPLVPDDIHGPEFPPARWGSRCPHRLPVWQMAYPQDRLPGASKSTEPRPSSRRYPARTAIRGGDDHGVFTHEGTDETRERMIVNRSGKIRFRRMGFGSRLGFRDRTRTIWISSRGPDNLRLLAHHHHGARNLTPKNRYQGL